MKTNNRLFYILISITILISCKKHEINTYDYYYLNNNTNDTMKIEYSIGPYGYDYYNLRLNPKSNSKLDISKIKNIVFLNIYKNNSILLISFKKDSLPYNYTRNLFDINNWDKSNMVNVYKDEYGNSEIGAVKVIYAFNIDTTNIINY